MNASPLALSLYSLCSLCFYWKRILPSTGAVEVVDSINPSTIYLSRADRLFGLDVLRKVGKLDNAECAEFMGAKGVHFVSASNNASRSTSVRMMVVCAQVVVLRHTCFFFTANTTNLTFLLPLSFTVLVTLQY